jgi:hypothetical protein
MCARVSNKNFPVLDSVWPKSKLLDNITEFGRVVVVVELIREFQKRRNQTEANHVLQMRFEESGRRQPNILVTGREADKRRVEGDSFHLSTAPEKLNCEGKQIE